MADSYLVLIKTDTNDPVKIRLVDNGDGTFSMAQSLTGSNLMEQKTQAAAVGGVLTFSAVITTVEIYNTDATNAGTFTVNGILITVPAGKVFKAGIGGTPAATVSVTGATTYIVSRYA